MAVVFFYLVFRKPLAASEQTVHSRGRAAEYPEPREAIATSVSFVLHAGVFVLVIVLLVTHARTGMSVALIGAIAAALTLLVAGRMPCASSGDRLAHTAVLHRPLHCVGGLEETGVLGLLADRMGEASGGSLTAVACHHPVGVCFASAIVDNIPFVAAMVPVVSALAQTPGLSLGTDVLGTGAGDRHRRQWHTHRRVGQRGRHRCRRARGLPVGWGGTLSTQCPRC